MKLLVASDLHFEFHRDGGRAMTESLASADVLVCPGDLSSALHLPQALTLLCCKFEHVVFTYGNHEFYGSSLSSVRERVQKLLRRLSQMENAGQLHVLDNSTCTIEGQRFIGTTMWTREQPGIRDEQRRMNDFNLIQNADPLLYEENRKALGFLERTLAPGDVVLTHHLPTQESVHPKYQDSPLNPFFLCDVQPLIEERKPKLWTHGHTHESANYCVGGTRVLCNPFGYAGIEENPSFDSELIVEV